MSSSLERVPKLGQMGEVVKVRNGYARNFLLPQGKALRASKANRDHFEAQRAQLEARNLERRKEAEAVAEKLEGQTFAIIRQAGETGVLYGSVATRDIAEVVTENGFSVSRNQIELNQAIKNLGVHAVKVQLHPEVEITINMNVCPLSRGSRAPGAWVRMSPPARCSISTSWASKSALPWKRMSRKPVRAARPPMRTRATRTSRADPASGHRQHPGKGPWRASLRPFRFAEQRNLKPRGSMRGGNRIRPARNPPICACQAMPPSVIPSGAAPTPKSRFSANQIPKNTMVRWLRTISASVSRRRRWAWESISPPPKDERAKTNQAAAPIIPDTTADAPTIGVKSCRFVTQCAPAPAIAGERHTAQ